MIFHTSKSTQSKTIKLLTNSKLTHCGIIFHKDGVPYVFEAVQPVKITPLNKWINRGIQKKYIVTRYKHSISKKDMDNMYQYAKKQLGKPYDLKFQWSNSKMYCSELIYKTYLAGNITLTKCKTFNDYNLNHPEAKKMISQRYNDGISRTETVIAPVDLYNSNMVKTIYDNY